MLAENNFSRFVGNINVEFTETRKKAQASLAFYKSPFIDIMDKVSFIIVMTLVGQLVISLIH
jgi:hypothetical protein